MNVCVIDLYTYIIAYKLLTVYENNEENTKTKFK